MDARASRLLALDLRRSDPEKSPTKTRCWTTSRLYWLTNTATSSARLYWEYGGRSPVFCAAAQKTAEISLPVAITVFPKEVYRAPETWARRAYRNLIYFHEVDKGGHFAAWEQPELFSAELRAAFRPLRQSILRLRWRGGARALAHALSKATGDPRRPPEEP